MNQIQEGTPTVPLNIYRKTMYQTDKGHILLEYELISGTYTEDVTRFMGVGVLQMQVAGQPHPQMVQREFIMPGIENVFDAFSQFEALMMKAVPWIQNKIQREMVEQAKAQSRIIRSDHARNPWKKPGGA
jgi:hypothetical protein